MLRRTRRKLVPSLIAIMFAMPAHGSTDTEFWTGAGCLRGLLGDGLLRCGSVDNSELLFIVSVDAASNVTKIASADPDAPPAVHEAARCLLDRPPGNLRKLAARASAERLASFEYGPFTVHCDGAGQASTR
ncbi:hypothetical protein ACQQ2N_20150 [Dokdonella sp. MW10]|uniref:hypothetical protein n=1 Tax=Dokdonella sp. MW10 TaxID=2992926 RepID=UPI003F7E37D1